MFAIPGVELPEQRQGNSRRLAQIGRALKTAHTRGNRCGVDVGPGRRYLANLWKFPETSMSANSRNNSRGRLPKVASTTLAVESFRDSLKEQLPKQRSRPTSAASSSRIGALSNISTRASSRASSRPTSASRVKSGARLPPMNGESPEGDSNSCKLSLTCLKPVNHPEAHGAHFIPCELALSTRPHGNQPQAREDIGPTFATNDAIPQGGPARSVGFSLSQEYEKLTGGCCGSVAAAWMEKSLRLGKRPSPEEIHACHAFFRYDVDDDGQLSFTEFGRLLQDQGLPVDLKQAIKALEVVAGSGSQGLQLEGFLQLIARAAEARCGFSESEIRVLRDVFDAYDTNCSGFLEAREYSALFADLGLAPSTKQESESLGSLIASCKKDSKLGPVDFKEFLALARKIDGNCDFETTLKP